MCAASATPEVEVEEDPVSAVMIPGTVVWLRYSTTQLDSTTGEGWRLVEVLGHGHVCDTDLGSDPSPDKDGWWCVHNNIRKFFLRIRILEVRTSSPPYLPRSP